MYAYVTLDCWVHQEADRRIVGVWLNQVDVETVAILENQVTH